MLAVCEDRLRAIADYHISEWAQRLEEIGGPGVGGTELAYVPSFVQSAETQDELIAMALESSIPATWEEAAWCYVLGRFRACIVMSAALLEITLKYELYRRKGIRKSRTLGTVIQKCSEEGILSGAARSLAQSVNQRRNDVMHANIQIHRPESLLSHTGDEHEIEPMRDLTRNITPNGWITGDGETIEISVEKALGSYSRVYPFKKAARASLFEAREILKSLYPPLPCNHPPKEEDKGDREAG